MTTHGKRQLLFVSSTQNQTDFSRPCYDAANDQRMLTTALS